MHNTPPVAGGALAETDDEKVLPGSVPDATDENRPRCALCPLCKCHGDCEGITDRPRRIRMTRRMPWRHLAPEAVIVQRRRNKHGQLVGWGNPHGVGEPCDVCDGRVHSRAEAVARYRWHLHTTPGLLAQARRELAGRDLACWCRLDEACHADVLLDAVNGEPGGGHG
jgi:hypothetical protein